MIAVIEGARPFLYAGYGLTWVVLSAYALFLVLKHRRLKEQK